MTAGQSELRDMSGKTCVRCGKGTYHEWSINCDWHGVPLRCTECKHEMPRWRRIGSVEKSDLKGGELIAALFVIKGGPYDIPGIDLWDIERDARKYAGPYSVIAHPPCERWGRYWFGGPSARVRRELGDDNGCFESAIGSVETYGGVLEHPEASHAFTRFGLIRPPKSGGWIRSREGWVCCVEQGHYGHLARKATWLYFVGPEKPPELKWGTSGQRLRMDYGYHSKEERARAVKTGRCQRLSKRQRTITPEPFRDLLISLVKK